MNHKEKRAYIGQHLDLSKTRLTESDADILCDFIDKYDDYKGKSKTVRHCGDGISSDGKWSWERETTYTFNNTPGIHEESDYTTDENEHSHTSRDITSGRGILDWFAKNKIR